MDVAKDPNYADNGWIYLSYSHVLASEDRRPPAMTRLVRGKLQGNEWVDQEVIYEAPTRHIYRRDITMDVGSCSTLKAICISRSGIAGGASSHRI